MTTRLFLAAGVLLASAPALAQSTSPVDQSSDDLVCQLSGDCGHLDQSEASRDKPASRGFKIARRTVVNDVQPAVASANKPRTAKGVPDAARPATSSAQPGRSRTISAVAPRAEVGSANLRVTFVTGSAELTDFGRQEAERVLSALAAPSLAGKKFRIEGHTDSVGSRERNLDLSKRRAQAVVDYLGTKGADPFRFSVVGYGPDKPIVGLDPSAGG